MTKYEVFELTDDQYRRVKKASRPTPVMFLSGGAPMFPSAQDNANRVWRGIADELGIIWSTIQHAPGKSDRFILAAVKEGK